MRTTIGTWAALLPLAMAGAAGCGSGGAVNADAVTTTPDANLAENPNANPSGVCSTGLPLLGHALDVSQPTAVIGTGTPGSCQFAQLAAAVAAGGTITFNCGPAPLAIPITATMHLPINKNTVIDGGNKIILDGGGTVQILRFDSANFQANETRVTIQHITFKGGAVTGTEPIPTAPAPCSQGFNAGDGGAIYMRDGNLTVIDSLFIDNHAAPLGPDVGGGAIRMLGSKHGIIVANSTFRNNSASNGAAIGCLFSNLEVYNSVVEGNQATGHDANSDDATKCSVINNGQHQVGSGGNGGALYSDGISTPDKPVNIVLCGDNVVNNAAGANAFGGGVFFTSNNFGGTLTITDTTISGNTGGHWTSVKSGSVTNAGTAVGTNAQSITITNSMVQGVN